MTGRWSVALAATAAALAIAAPATAAQRYLDPVFAGHTVQDGLVYGEAVNNRGELQILKLDVYAPTGDLATNRPALVFAHGGSFRNGTRKATGIVPLLEGWARRGYVAISIDYRLRPEGTPNWRANHELIAEAIAGDSQVIREAQHDMQAAVRWVRANAGTLGVDPDRIATGGESAGAITAWEAGINEADPGDSGTPGVSSKVKAIVSLWGTADPDHIEAGGPPVINIHGGADTTVPHAFGTQACALMIAWGNGCELVTLPLEPHAPFARNDDVLAETSDFMCRKLAAGCSVPAQLPVRLR